MQASVEILAMIGKKLSGHASVEELAKLQQWLESDILHREEYDEIITIWQDSSRILGEPVFESHTAWLKINDQIAAKPSSFKRPSLSRFAFRIAGVAAILAGLWLLGWYIWKTNRSSFQVQIAKNNEQLNLPDGSQVLLRKGSSLRYPVVFDEK